MKPGLLDAVEINPPAAPRACLIWLHGLGADGHDFETLIPELGLVNERAVRVVLPHAPYRPVTLNGGHVMRAWYDILAPDLLQGEDSQGIRESEQQLRALIEHEVGNGIPAEHIVLAGFSQGGAIALQTGLRYPQRLAGILALSTYIPLAATLVVERAAENAAAPIMMAHGLHDPVVPLALAERSRDQLLELGYALDWRSYPMPHAVCADEIAAIRGWLSACLP
jgi:phospholipase/carboxylesterase